MVAGSLSAGRGENEILESARENSRAFHPERDLRWARKEVVVRVSFKGAAVSISRVNLRANSRKVEVRASARFAGWELKQEEEEEEGVGASGQAN